MKLVLSKNYQNRYHYDILWFHFISLLQEHEHSYNIIAHPMSKYLDHTLVLLDVILASTCGACSPFIPWSVYGQYLFPGLKSMVCIHQKDTKVIPEKLWWRWKGPAQNGTLVIINYLHAIWLGMIRICPSRLHPIFQSNCALMLCWPGLVAAGQSGIQLLNIYFAGPSGIPLVMPILRTSTEWHIGDLQLFTRKMIWEWLGFAYCSM